MNYSKRFVVDPGTKVKLHKVDPGYIDSDVPEKDALEETKKLCKRLRELQASLYCEKQRSVLIVLQALDTAGKDGVINHVLGAMNPLSCRVASFKKPGPEEAAHNYLWRVSIFLPEKGEMVIFNRSHYEDVLVVRVHDLAPKDQLVPRQPGIDKLLGLLSNVGSFCQTTGTESGHEQEICRAIIGR
jgi:polyphosphate kinase 2 (PPK2 family)